MQTTFPRLMLEHASARPAAPALRVKEFGIWQTTTWAQLAQLVRDLSLRCDELKLQVEGDDPALLVQVTAYLTALVTNYLFTGKFKRTK